MSDQKVSYFPTISVGIFLALHLLPTHINGLWGLDALSFYPAEMQWAFVALSILILIPQIRPFILLAAKKFTTPIPFHHPITLVLILIMGGCLFWTFRSAIPLLGDGSKLLRELDALMQGQKLEVNRAPLVFWLLSNLCTWVHDALTTFQIYSLISGLLYLSISWWIARSFQTHQIFAFIAFCSTGFMQLFFGYVETYALLFPVTLFYLWLGLRVLNQQSSLFIPACLLGILIPIHFVSITLIPSLIVLGYQISGPLRLRIQRCIIGPSIAAIITFLILILIAYHPQAYTTTAGRTPFLPLFQSDPLGYAILSFTHALNVLNAYLLSAPLFFFALMYGAAFRLSAHNIFLGCTALFTGLFTLIANPEIGAFRDWDVFSYPAISLTLWSVLAIKEHNKTPYVSILFSIAIVLHTTLWIGLNADARKSEVRFEHLLKTVVLPPEAQSYGWETLGEYLRRQQTYDRAIESYKQAIEIRPNNARHWNNLGGILCDVKQFELAIDVLQQAIALNPNLATAHLNLADAYFAQQNFETARKHYQTAQTLNLNKKAKLHIQTQLNRMP